MKAVIFDLDGIITDTAGYHFLAWKALAEELDINIDNEFNEQLKGISRIESLERILRKGKVENKFSLAEKEELAVKKNEEYKKMIEQMSSADILPGIERLLYQLNKANILIGLASASQNGPVILKKLGLHTLFDTIVDPATLSAGKPDPEIFEKAAEQLNCLVSECVGIEDAAAGVESINRANMVSIAVGDAQVLSAADKTMDSTEELTMERIKKAWTEFSGTN